MDIIWAMVVGSCFVDIALFLDEAGRVSSVSRYSRVLGGCGKNSTTSSARLAGDVLFPRPKAWGARGADETRVLRYTCTTVTAVPGKLVQSKLHVPCMVTRYVPCTQAAGT